MDGLGDQLSNCGGGGGGVGGMELYTHLCSGYSFKRTQTLCGPTVYLEHVKMEARYLDGWQ